ncbi:hypothetical protein AALP_AA3G082700 [Arabis alpina]|uniref:EF-hand domain-containing protein n=1 Tax=Arabis alpina TaxID=50452 RepID=A0A087H7V4_ARAAL|nr:hypothetical protein AALP_AA3G082700 [Arabis alpina]
MFDRNGDGKITKQELNDSLENLGIYIPDKDLVQMIEKIDLNGDGYVDIEEFGGLYQTIMEERDEEEDMREAFNVFDQNRDGFITVEELRSVLASLGLKQGRTLEDCKRMISKVDVDGDGMFQRSLLLSILDFSLIFHRRRERHKDSGAESREKALSYMATAA